MKTPGIAQILNRGKWYDDGLATTDTPNYNSDQHTQKVRWKKLLVSGELLHEIFQQGWKIPFDVEIETVEGVPPGARLVVGHWDVEKVQLELVFEHASFDEIKLGDTIPIMTGMFRRETRTPVE